MSGDYTIYINIISALSALLVSIATAWMFRKRMAHSKIIDNKLLGDFLVKIIFWMIILSGVFLFLSILGINIHSLLTFLGAIGISLGIALQQTIAEYIKSFLFIFTRQIKIGDTIIYQGHTGTIKKIDIYSIILQHIDGNKIIIPTSKISTNIIIKIPH